MAKKSSLFQFTQAQLEGYIKDENSCVKRVPSKMHIGFPPYGLENFKETLLSIISKKKIGSYDEESRGIVLDVRNIKLEGTMSHIRYDSPELHMNIFANFYVFQPHLGALLKGTVKHISKRHVSALIYSVFNVSIRLNGDFMRKLQVNKEISFRVKKFDLQNVLPYIEGELVDSGKDDENGGDSGIGDGDKKRSGKSADAKPNKKISFGDTSDSSSDDDDSEDEKAFKSMVMKTETVSKAATARSSEEDSDSSDEEEEIEKKPILKEVKRETSAIRSSSSSDESSDEEEAPLPVPKPLPAVKTEKTTPNKEKNGGKKSSSDSSSESDSEEEEASAAQKFPPSQFHTAKAAAAIKQESSSDDSSSSSEEEQFKIPLPIVKQEGGQIVVKREMTPSRRDEKKDSSSSQSESEGKKPEKVKRKILQATPEKSPPKKTKSSDKESADSDGSKSKKTKKLTEKQKKLVKTPKTTPTVVATSRKEVSSSSDSSSDSGEEDERFQGAINLNDTIQSMAKQILAKKSDIRPTAAAKTPKSLFGKRKSAGAEVKEVEEAEPAEKKKKPSKKEKTGEGELSCFGADVLSSTRLDSASPMAKPKMKKKKSTTN